MNKSIISTVLATVVCLVMRIESSAQDLLAELEKKDKGRKELTLNTFKGTRIINGHSVELKGAGELEFIISHRFGALNSGSYNFYGLDQAFIRLGLEYGISDRLGVGIGRSSFNKVFDGYLKYKMLQQAKGGSPITITAFGSVAVQTYPQQKYDSTLTLLSRCALTYQLMIARKFSSKFSMQLSPTLVHTNRVDKTIADNDQVALGIGGRYKITRSVAISAEYYQRINPHVNSPYRDAIGIGVDIETGGHVFQLVVSNTQAVVERSFINETSDDFFNGGIHLGFNITRTFQLKGKK